MILVFGSRFFVYCKTLEPLDDRLPPLNFALYFQGRRCSYSCFFVQFFWCPSGRPFDSGNFRHLHWRMTLVFREHASPGWGSYFRIEFGHLGLKDSPSQVYLRKYKNLQIEHLSSQYIGLLKRVCSCQVNHIVRWDETKHEKFKIKYFYNWERMWIQQSNETTFVCCIAKQSLAFVNDLYIIVEAVFFSMTFLKRIVGSKSLICISALLRRIRYVCNGRPSAFNTCDGLLQLFPCLWPKDPRW